MTDDLVEGLQAEIRRLTAALAAETRRTDQLANQLNERNLEKVCRTCANSGWIGSRADPKPCPTCGRTPYYLEADQ